MKFTTTLLVSTLVAVAAVAAVPIQSDDSLVFARYDNGELFVRFDDILDILEARGGFLSTSKPPKYKKAARDPPPPYRGSTHHTPEFVTTYDTHHHTDYSSNTKSGSGHHRSSHASGSGSRRG